MKTMYKLFALSDCSGRARLPAVPPRPAPTEPPAPEPTKAEAEPTKAPEPEPTKAPEPEPTEGSGQRPRAGLTCDEPIKVGLISDLTGGLAIYGTHIERASCWAWSMPPAPRAPTTASLCSTAARSRSLLRDDQSNAENTATVARELIEVDDVDILVGTVSSGSTATLQEIAMENDVVLHRRPGSGQRHHRHQL